MRPQGSREKRVVAFSASLGLAAATLLIVAPAPAAEAGISSCQARDVRKGPVSSDLQAVIDAAKSGRTIQVKGICAGRFTIDKDLKLVGKRTSEFPRPGLRGHHRSSVLRLSGGRDVQVVLEDLRITHGGGDKDTSGERLGGGIYNQVTLKLKGSTLVSHNLADFGGGIYSHGGRVTMSQSASVTNNGAYTSGGALYQWHSSLTMTNHSKVSGNSATYGGGIFGGVVRMSDSALVSGNHADYDGGGIYANIVLSDSSSVVGNQAIYGGGIFNRGTVKLRGSSSVSENSADHGGGIESEGSISLNGSSSVSGNSASNGGGGIDNYGTVTLKNSASVRRNVAQMGGGIYNSRRVTLNGRSMITRNTAQGKGGGIYNDSGTVKLTGSSAVVRNRPDNCVHC